VTTDQLMPAAFLGHGNPMNALDRNRYTQAWRAFGAAVPRPRAILVVSAHWYTNATAVTRHDGWIVNPPCRQGRQLVEEAVVRVADLEPWSAHDDIEQGPVRVDHHQWSRIYPGRARDFDSVRR
jgi:hypothetical protein